MKVPTTILKDSEHRGVVAYGIQLLLREQSREAMENGVVDVEDASGLGELGGVPVVVGGENGGLGLGIDAEDEGLGRVCRGKGRTLREEEEEEEEEEERCSH